MKATSYKIACAESLAELEGLVQQYVEDGYLPIGGIVKAEGLLAQPVVLQQTEAESRHERLARAFNS